MTAAAQAPAVRSPRVLVVGPIYGGSLETARSTARASETLGAETRLLDFDAFGAGWHALGRKLTYVDLSLFQVMVGLEYAFPNALAALGRKLPRLRALRDGVAAVPPVAWYLASPRRIPFNEYGIFRHYPELDPAPRGRRQGRARAS